MAGEKTYDYVVVGAGASGCVVANRLTEDPNTSVLLLEAGGPDELDDIHDPGGFVRLWGSDVDWKFNTTDQAALGGRAIQISQGRVMGGSTSINAMMYVRGNRGNYDQWRDMGADGWGFDEVLPYFKKSEDYEEGESTYHGAGGPLRVRICPDDAMRSEPFMLAATQVGYDGPYWDTNGERQENGAGLLQFHINEDGKRASASTAFIDPIRDRENLTIIDGAMVTRILFDDKRAVGVEYVKDGETQQVHFDGEVILSAGAFLSPKILMLSGVGPADHLAEMGIDVVANLAGVGQNLQDHMQLPVIYRTKVNNPNTTLLTGNALFVNTRGDGGLPDLQLNFTPAAPKPLLAAFEALGPICVFLPILVQPYSIGEVRLASADPTDAPVINPNYLEDDRDVNVFREAVNLIRRMANTEAFADMNDGEIAPGDGDLDGYIRSQSSTLWHPAGTCKIGKDEMAVVDPQLRVHGVEGVRVADASVMPTVPSGNTVAGCFMIGEKAADMIRQGA